MQIALSHILFLDNKYQYEDKIVSKSVLYRVSTKFKSQRKILNRGLVKTIFADKVLLAEGPSEDVLFGKVLSEINPFYEAG